MFPASALACPSSLKGVLSASSAAAALAAGLRAVGVETTELPVADGGEGTLDAVQVGEVQAMPVHDAFGRPRSARIRVESELAIVEAAEVIPLDPATARHSRRVEPRARRADRDTRLEAARDRARRHGHHGRRKRAPGGARSPTGSDPRALRRRDPPLRRPTSLRAPERGDAGAGRPPRATLPRTERADPVRGAARVPGPPAGSGPLSRHSVPSSSRERRRCSTSSDSSRAASISSSRERGRWTRRRRRERRPAEVVRRCLRAGVPVVVFGGRVIESVPGVETIVLSGDPARAAADLEELGARLGARLLDALG